MKITEISTDDGQVKISLRDPKNNFWAIIQGMTRLNRNGSWSIEPIPSNRTKEFIEQHSFTYEEALIELQKYEV